MVPETFVDVLEYLAPRATDFLQRVEAGAQLDEFELLHLARLATQASKLALDAYAEIVVQRAMLAELDETGTAPQD